MFFPEQHKEYEHIYMFVIFDWLKIKNIYQGYFKDASMS